MMHHHSHLSLDVTVLVCLLFSRSVATRMFSLVKENFGERMRLSTVCLCFFAVNINYCSFLVKSETLECSESRWHVCCGWILVVTEQGCVAVVECYPSKMLIERIRCSRGMRTNGA